MPKFTIYILLLSLSHLTAGQGSYFTQTGSVPLQLNPARIATNDDATLMLDYRRQQFLEDISLQSTVLTGKYPLIKKGTNQRWGGVGISLLADHPDEHPSFQRAQLDVAFAYNFSLTPRTFLSWGVQGGYHQQRFLPGSVTTGSQYVPSVGFDPGVNSGENIDGSQQSSYWNVGSGLYLYRTDTKREVTTYLGMAVQRIQPPQELFLAGNYRLPRRYLVQAGQRVFDNGRWTITPNVLWIRERPQSLLRGGATYAYRFKNNNPLDPLRSGSVEFGTYYTNVRALLLSLHLNQPNFSAGFSYDVGTAGQTVQNATELTLAVRKTINRRPPPRVIRDYSVKDVRRFYETEPTSRSRPATRSTQPGATPDTGEESVASGPDDDTTNPPVAFHLKRTFEFAFNDATLTPEARAYFDDFVGLLQMNPTLRLRVVGHTDNVGSERTNRRVSRARALSVKDYLVAQGVDADRIEINGVGSSEPLVDNTTAANRAKNRRVELIVSQPNQR
jgi:type IX secretion system PorP/SprF family membrane protein